MILDIKELNKVSCIVCDKIFYQCKTREYIPKVEIPLKNIKKQNIKFSQGFILDGSLYIYDIKDRPNFKRAIFEIKVPFQIKTQSGVVYKGFVSNIKRDIVLFMPDSKRDEFNFKLRIETSSKLLGDVIEEDNKSYFTLGTYIIINVVSKVELLIPSSGYCYKPSMCLNFELKDDIYNEFYKKPFPEFYPPQYKKGRIWIRKDIKVRKINDVIIYGQIYRNNKQEPVQRATIMAFYTDEVGNLKIICHTYSNTNGYYILNIPPQFEGETITVMVSKDSYKE